MGKRKKIIAPFLLIGLLLTGCAEENNQVEAESELPTVETSETSKTTETTKQSSEVTLHIEDSLTKNMDEYTFNGFIGEDTLAFEEEWSHKTIKAYHPAKKGHKFSLKSFEGITLEVIDFSREEGYVTLKLTNS